MTVFSCICIDICNVKQSGCDGQGSTRGKEGKGATSAPRSLDIVMVWVRPMKHLSLMYPNWIPSEARGEEPPQLVLGKFSQMNGVLDAELIKEREQESLRRRPQGVVTSPSEHPASAGSGF